MNILPCPFCGSDKIESTYVRDGHTVFCKKCYAQVTAYMPNAKSNAIEKWNTRVASVFNKTPLTKKL